MKLLNREKPVERLSLENRYPFTASRWVGDEYVKALESESLPMPALKGCRRCGRLHTEVPSHCTDFHDYRGMCPMCETCWWELETPEARMPWYRGLWLLWEMEALYEGCPVGSHIDGLPPFERGHDREPWEIIEAAVLAGL